MCTLGLIAASFMCRRNGRSRGAVRTMSDPIRGPEDGVSLRRGDRLPGSSAVVSESSASVMSTLPPAQKTSRMATFEESVYVSPADVNCDQTRPKCRAHQRTWILPARHGVPLATRHEVLNRRTGPLLKMSEWKATK